MKTTTFVGILILGILSCVFSVLGPLHEVWHWLAASLHGVKATMGWAFTYLNTDKVGLFIGYAGMFGEVTVHMLIFFKLVQKKHYKWATYFFGYFSSYVIIIVFTIVFNFLPIDLDVMIANVGRTPVMLVFYLFSAYYMLLMTMQILTLREFKEYFFTSQTTYKSRKLVEGVKKIQESNKKVQKSSQNDTIVGENRYNALTLVK